MAYIKANLGGGAAPGSTFPAAGSAYVFDTPNSTQTPEFSIKSAPTFTYVVGYPTGCGGFILNTDGYASISITNFSGGSRAFELDVDGTLLATQTTGTFTFNASTRYLIVVTNSYYSGTPLTTYTVTLS